MGADDAHSDPILHTTAVRTWHQAAVVVIVVPQTDQIAMSAHSAKTDKQSKNDTSDPSKNKLT